MTISGPVSLKTLAVSSISIVTGSGPQSKTMMPPWRHRGHDCVRGAARRGSIPNHDVRHRRVHGLGLRGNGCGAVRVSGGRSGSRIRLDGAQAHASHEKGGHLFAGDGSVRTVDRVGGRVAPLGDAGRSETVDVLFENSSRIRERRLGRRRQVESPHQECRHLPTGDDSVRTVDRVGRRVAPLRDAGRGETVDVLLEDPCRVRERCLGRRRQSRSPHQKRRHLPACHGSRRTEQVVRRWIAALGDADGGNGLDGALMHTVVVVGETASRREIGGRDTDRTQHDHEREKRSDDKASGARHAAEASGRRPSLHEQNPRSPNLRGADRSE